jgi:hypothetical protein
MYLRSVCVGEYKGGFFSKPIDGTATSVEVFNIINNFLKGNEINWENLTELCIDGAQSMSARNGELQTMV